MRVTSTAVHASRWRSRLTCAVAAALLMGSGLACIMQGVPGAGGPVGAAIMAGTAAAATIGYRKLTGGCYATCSQDWHCDHESGFCKPDAREQPRRLVRKALDAGVPPALDGGVQAGDAGE
jgi:hypothetical protein